ncbi:Uncharacterised protein [Mycobacteroides abscessus subsp. abscessus]|nr:Uncharacterised protein [Mycobacteroides abscessus subsp. abscessus]
MGLMRIRRRRCGHSTRNWLPPSIGCKVYVMSWHRYSPAR